MKKKRAFIIAIVTLIVFIGVIIAAVYIYLAPSSTQRSMKEQYPDIAKDEVMVVVNDQILETKGILREGHIYMPAEIVQTYFNKRFYWDNKENILSYVEPSGVVTTGLKQKTYSVGISQEEAEANIVIRENDVTYFLMDFVAKYSALEYKTYENPSRLVAVSDFKNQYTYAVLGEDARLRVGPNKKYDYLVDLTDGQKLYIDSEAKVENEYQKVMTLDGIVGYIKEDEIEKKVEEVSKTDFTVPVFEQTKFAENICLAWHQVTNQNTNAYLGQTIASMKNVNVISPTWLSLSDNKGNFDSLASATYVQQAHNAGLKVWMLIDDFNKKINLQRLLGRTSTRQQLINNLIATAIRYNVDGLNIDFEGVTEKSAAAYLEFLRELSLKCHANQLVLSTDTYMPKSYNAHYDREEQGKIVDYVIFMGYDEHYAGSEEAGSVSSIGFIKEGLEKGLTMVPKERLVMALPFYTRLWKETTKKDKQVELTSEAYGMDRAQEVVSSSHAYPKWDETTMQYYAEFKKGRSVYRIWLEEEKSLEEKMKVVSKSEIAGLAFWKLGFERSTIWDVVGKYTK